MNHITEFFRQLADPNFLQSLIQKYGGLIYLIMGTIVFLETGLFVLAPFLPSDTLIFAAGALSGSGLLQLDLLIIIFTIAAVLGDSLNFLLGRLTTKPLFSGRVPWLNQQRLRQVRYFYNQHGNITIFYGRFIPVVRSLVPFTAGSASVTYARFLAFCSMGVLLWVLLNSTTGFLFGGLPFVKENPALILIGMAIIPLIPAVIQISYSHFHKKKR